MSITDKLSLITSAAATLDVVASVQDKTTSTGALASVSQRTAITTAATTDVVAVPGSGVERNIVELSIRNKHASTATDVTVQLNANATLYEIVKYTLNAGDTLEYVEGIGWFIITNAAALDKRLIVATDVVNATTSFADITGLTCPVLSGKNYSFMAHLFHVNDASTTGSQFGVNGPTMTSNIFGTIDTVTPSVTASAHSAGVVATLNTAITAQTTGATAQRLAIISGWIKPSANGTFAMRCASEVAVAAGLTVKAGSWCRIWEATG